METPETLVRRNVRSLREQRRLTVRSLSALLVELGRPILPSGITKIEDGSRRVHVGDLVALAIALGVMPNRLLLPSNDMDEAVQLTPKLPEVSAYESWNWASGRWPLHINSIRESLRRADTGEEITEDDVRRKTEQERKEHDDFYRHAWPDGERLANEHTASRAARDVANRLHVVLQDRADGRTDPLGDLRRALARLVAEVDDLIGDDDGR